MGVARVTAMVLFASAMIALAVLLAPSVGLWRRPRACGAISIAGAAVAAIALCVQIAAPATQGSSLTWANLSTDYFLAMAHLFRPEYPYPSFWTPVWVYQVGTLTPLIAAGGVSAAAAGYAAFRVGLRAVAIPMLIGLAAIIFFVTAATFAARATWYGIAV